MPVVGRQSTPTATPLPGAVVNVRGLNVRSGPGTTYRIVTGVVENDTLLILGRDANCRWLQVRTAQDIEGWVASTYVGLDRNCNTIDAAATPTPRNPSSSSTSVSTATGGAGTVAATVAPAGAGKSVELVRPLAAGLGGRQVFEWRANFALESGQLFELILWRPGQEPMASGFSPVGAGTATQVNVNFDMAIAAMSQLEAGADYHWGVLLVTLNPYHRLQYLGAGHRFRLGGSAAATSISAHTPTVFPTLLPFTREPADTPTHTPASEPATLEPADTPAVTLEPALTDTPTSELPTEVATDTPQPDTPTSEPATLEPAVTPTNTPAATPSSTPEPEPATSEPAVTPTNTPTGPPSPLLRPG